MTEDGVIGALVPDDVAVRVVAHKPDSPLEILVDETTVDHFALLEFLYQKYMDVDIRVYLKADESYAGTDNIILIQHRSEAPMFKFSTLYYMVVERDKHADDQYHIFAELDKAILRARALVAKLHGEYYHGPDQHYAVSMDGSEGCYFSESGEDSFDVFVQEIKVPL